MKVNLLQSFKAYFCICDLFALILYPTSRLGGALIQRAEIIPHAPDPDNAGEGRK
jgi:hypothetical protein